MILRTTQLVGSRVIHFFQEEPEKQWFAGEVLARKNSACSIKFDSDGVTVDDIK
jgi:hypothetical protein